MEYFEMNSLLDTSLQRWAPATIRAGRSGKAAEASTSSHDSGSS